MPDEERDPEGAAGIARRGLDPHPLERPFAEDASVADAVEGDAPGEAEVRTSRSRAWTWRTIRRRISSVTFCTEAARSISRWVSGDSGLPRRTAEELGEALRGHGQTLAEVEVLEIEAE